MKKNKNNEDFFLNLDSLEPIRPGLVTRVLLWLAPRWGVARLAREMGYPLMDAAEQMHKAFTKAKRVDVLPGIGAGPRSFQLVLDGVLALYFFQNGDHFIYDGFELGEYERGSVRLFDKAYEQFWESREVWEE